MSHFQWSEVILKQRFCEIFKNLKLCGLTFVFFMLDVVWIELFRVHEFVDSLHGNWSLGKWSIIRNLKLKKNRKICWRSVKILFPIFSVFWRKILIWLKKIQRVKATYLYQTRDEHWQHRKWKTQNIEETETHKCRFGVQYIFFIYHYVGSKSYQRHLLNFR